MATATTVSAAQHATREAIVNSTRIARIIGGVIWLSLSLQAKAGYPYGDQASCTYNGDCQSLNCVQNSTGSLQCCGECGQSCLSTADCCQDQGALVCTTSQTCEASSTFLYSSGSYGTSYQPCLGTCDCYNGYCTSQYDGIDGVPATPSNVSYCIGCFSELKTTQPNPGYVDPCIQCCDDTCLVWPGSSNDVCCNPLGAACTPYSDGGSGCCWDAGPTFLTCGPKGVCCANSTASNSAPDCSGGKSNICCSGVCTTDGTKACVAC